jgi:hypothetical protein
MTTSFQSIIDIKAKFLQMADNPAVFMAGGDDTVYCLSANL